MEIDFNKILNIDTKETTETVNLEDNKISYLDLLDTLFEKYEWFKNRFNNMDPQHQNGFKLSLDNTNSIAYHLDLIFSKNLSEDGKTLPLNTWRLKKLEYRLFMMLGVPDEGDCIEPVNDLILPAGMELK